MDRLCLQDCECVAPTLGEMLRPLVTFMGFTDSSQSSSNDTSFRSEIHAAANEVLG